MKPSRLARLKTPFKKLNEWIALACAAIDAARNITHGGGPVTITQTPFGTSIGVRPFPIAIAVTTSTITVRSGNTPGSGTVDFKLFDVTTPAFSADSALTGVKVYNYSSSTPAVASGKWVMLFKVNGSWFVASQECS